MDPGKTEIPYLLVPYFQLLRIKKKFNSNITSLSILDNAVQLLALLQLEKLLH